MSLEGIHESVDQKEEKPESVIEDSEVAPSTFGLIFKGEEEILLDIKEINVHSGVYNNVVGKDDKKGENVNSLGLEGQDEDILFGKGN